MRYKVYLDMVFFVNAGMDIILLLLMKQLLHKKGTFWGIVIGGVLGGVGACVLQLLTAHIGTIMQIVIYYGIAVGMILVSFGQKRWLQNLLDGVKLFFLSYFFSGVVGFFYGRQDETDWNLLLAIGGGVLLVLLGGSLKKAKEKSGLYVKVSLSLRKKDITLVGYLDSGNSLYDPVSGEPVVIVLYDAVKSFLPKELHEILERYFNDGVLSVASLQTLMGMKIRLVPYETVGSKKQMMFCVESDKVVLEEDKREYIGVFLGFTTNGFQNPEQCQVILHREMME